MSDKQVQECVARAEAEYEWMKDKIHDQYEEIERLKDLCNKYEEEHNTTFQEWKIGISAREEIANDYKQRIDKALNKINNMFDNGNENTVIDDLLELEKILKGE